MYVRLDWPKVTQLVCEFGPSTARPGQASSAFQEALTVFPDCWLVFLPRQAGVRPEDGEQQGQPGALGMEPGYPRSNVSIPRLALTREIELSESAEDGGWWGDPAESPASAGPHLGFSQDPADLALRRQELPTALSTPSFITTLHGHLVTVEASLIAPVPLGRVTLGSRSHRAARVFP